MTNSLPTLRPDPALPANLELLYNSKFLKMICDSENVNGNAQQAESTPPIRSWHNVNLVIGSLALGAFTSAYAYRRYNSYVSGAWGILAALISLVFARSIGTFIRNTLFPLPKLSDLAPKIIEQLEGSYTSKAQILCKLFNENHAGLSNEQEAQRLIRELSVKYDDTNTPLFEYENYTWNLWKRASLLDASTEIASKWRISHQVATHYVQQFVSLDIDNLPKELFLNPQQKETLQKIRTAAHWFLYGGPSSEIPTYVDLHTSAENSIRAVSRK